MAIRNKMKKRKSYVHRCLTLHQSRLSFLLLHLKRRFVDVVYRCLAESRQFGHLPQVLLGGYNILCRVLSFLMWIGQDRMISSCFHSRNQSGGHGRLEIWIRILGTQRLESWFPEIAKCESCNGLKSIPRSRGNESSSRSSKIRSVPV